MCIVDGCDTQPVKVQLVRLDPPELLKTHCRPHYVERCRTGGTLVRCEVVGKAIIVHVDGSEVGEGGFAELNTEEINIGMLVDLGYVKVAPAAPPAKSSTAAKG